MSKFIPKTLDKKRYVLKDPKDLVILEKIYKLEKKKLPKSDKEIVAFVRTQLKDDWRSPIVSFLNRLARKYK